MVPSEAEQIQNIAEAERAIEAPSAFSFSQADMDEVLRHGSGIEDGKLRIYALYQHQPDRQTAVDFLKEEYGWGGHSHTFLDGTAGFANYSPKGLRLQHYDPGYETTFQWSAIEKRLRTLIAEDSYLTDAEKARYAKLEQDFAGLGGVPMPSAHYAFPAPVQPAERKITQAEIDAALQEWNGDMDSKRAVVRYMAEHGREKDTAAWLKGEYGDDLPAFPVTVEGAALDLPWPKVQRRIAQLIKEDRFFTPEEQDRMEDVDPVAIREALAQRGIVNGEVVDPEALDSDPFIRQVMADAEQAEPVVPAAENFRITDDNLGVGGPKAKFRANLEAINLLKELEAEGRQATPEEQEVLSRYVGWGGLAEAFDESKSA